MEQTPKNEPGFGVEETVPAPVNDRDKRPTGQSGDNILRDAESQMDQGNLRMKEYLNE